MSTETQPVIFRGVNAASNYGLEVKRGCGKAFHLLHLTLLLAFINLCMSRVLGQPVLKLEVMPPAAGRVVLSWPSATGDVYTLRVTSDLSQPWTIYPTQPSPLLSAGTQMQYEVPVDAGVRFFQVGRVITNQTADSSALATQIVEGTTPEQVVAATQQALAAGGITVGDVGRVDVAAQYPPASWFIDPRLVLNVAMEAHNRPVSGRFTLADLGQMWQDVGFPFAGTGTPGEQLLGFLKIWKTEAMANPGAVSSFAPLFIAAMVGHQAPPVSLDDPQTRPDDVRLSLLEVELLMAAFDRAFQPGVNPVKAPLPSGGDASTPPQYARLSEVSLQMDPGFCTSMKKFYGTIGAKLLDKSVGYVKGQLNDAALKAIGMSEAEIKQFNTYQKYFDALNMAMKIVKMLQIYASTDVMLTVDGQNPVHKPHKGQARKLDPVTARAGIPDDAWQQYQDSHNSQAYQDVKDCLGFMGMPLPYDLKDIAGKVDTWRVSWDLASGSPKHAVIPSDVNNFNAPSSGNPFGMKLVRDGAATAKATLNVDIKEEPRMATQFLGPVKTSPVKVKAKVFTAEPPSPLLVAKLTTLLGTISTLVDISTGWMLTMVPPTGTTTIKVQYHDLPESVEATVDLDMRFNFTHFTDEPAEFEQTARGTWAAKLYHITKTLGPDLEVDAYKGTNTFIYQSASNLKLGSDASCITYVEQPINGLLVGTVSPTFNQSGQYMPDEPIKFNLGAISVQTAPQEKETMFDSCNETTITFTMPKIIIGAVNDFDLMDEGILFEMQSQIPGLYLDLCTLMPDGALERVITGPKTIQIKLADGVTSLSEVKSQNNKLRLKPTFAP